MPLISEVQSFRRAPVTVLILISCFAIWLGLALLNDYENWDTISSFGYYAPNDIWAGKFWGLITPAFVHFDLWHLWLNIAATWYFGGHLEAAIGSLRYAVFVCVAALVSSAFQLAASDSTGIGFSGVGYAIFGFMWITKDRFSSFRSIMSQQVIRLWLGWLVFCVIVTEAGIMQVGNAAHMAGLLFGVAVADVCVTRNVLPASALGVSLLLGFSILICFWCPWSVTWLGIQAYDAHVSKNYLAAERYYTRILDVAPENAWALINRGGARIELGKIPEAWEDDVAARKLEPSLPSNFQPEDQEESEIPWGAGLP